MSATNYLGLNIPDKNSKGRVVTEVFEPNFTKLDQNAEVVDRDKNAIWGGLDGGGLIEDPSITKVVGKRYIGADGKAYICLVPSNVNNTTNYAPCNVVDNLDKLQNLQDKIFIKPYKPSNEKIKCLKKYCSTTFVLKGTDGNMVSHSLTFKTDENFGFQITGIQGVYAHIILYVENGYFYIVRGGGAGIINESVETISLLFFD